ncbi:ubiquitin-conjugating enzyme E2 J1-like [Pollicipes pollicipes]|uniref:ubiquitin-conjugating enzyme E2 J1-like n=1 Tax=Pollicipes pollicipes TaxID=41117 RepID=UPI00188528C4|nr:ubiquitin-conjugating enzyme E2 J1-like [Pollicipes pollicipes]
MEAKYNTKSPAVKRLMREAKELHQPTADYFAQPLEDNLFEWHFTVRGPDDTAFEGGVYHGRILLPADYPMKPPSIIMLTPNGRFETGKKICLSISGHHPESWRPSWSIRTALMAIIGFLPTPAGGAIASLEYGEAERRALAAASLRWQCAACGPPPPLLAAADDRSGHDSRQREARQLAAEVNFQTEMPVLFSGTVQARGDRARVWACSGGSPRERGLAIV